MEKTINISGKDIRFKMSAGTLHRYRFYFGQDMLNDITKLDKIYSKVKTDGSNFNFETLEVFEKVAWTMAKTADENIKNIDKWLDDFEAFDIYSILPELFTLVSTNFTNANEKKNLIIPKAELIK